MCGRFTQKAPWKKIKKEFAARTTESNLFQPRYNIAPLQIVPVVRDAESERIISTLKWGLVPSWSKDADIGNRMIKQTYYHFSAIYKTGRIFTNVI